MSELFDFLNEKKKEDEQQQVDWEMVKRDWIATLDSFMKDIQDWLNQKEQEGAIKIVRDEIEIIEEHLGKYQASRLRILIGASEVKIEPIGRLIIGATGRVDISSFAESYIVLNNANNEWKYRDSVQQHSYKTFNKENFAEILKGLLYEN